MGPIAPEAPPPPDEPPAPALGTQGARPVVLLVILATLLSMGFTFANCALETGGGQGPSTRISPLGAGLENAIPIVLVVAGITLAIVYRARGAGFIAFSVGVPFFIATVGGSLMTCTRGHLFESMSDVETVGGGPHGQAAHLRSNGGGCYEVYVSEPGSILMHRRGRFHANHEGARIVWIDGEITHGGIPLKNGNAYCKDWL